MLKQYWTCICPGDRTAAISAINLIAARFGTIIQFQRYSDLELSLLMETVSGSVHQLFEALQEHMHTEGYSWQDEQGPAAVYIFLRVTFASGRGDLAIEVPNLPD